MGSDPSKNPDPSRSKFELSSPLLGHIALVILGLLCMGVATAIAVIITNVPNLESSARTPLLAIVSIGGLLVALTIMTVVFSALNLSDKRFPLGLPDGSIPAVIALGMMVIFVVVPMTIFDQIGKSLETISNLKGDEELKNLSSKLGANYVTSIESGKSSDGKVLYTVYFKNSDPSKTDFAKQLFTTISTLVTAVAGFYFGSRATAVGAETSAKSIASGVQSVAQTVADATSGKSVSPDSTNDTNRSSTPSDTVDDKGKGESDTSEDKAKSD